MKKLTIVVLSLSLTACSTLSPFIEKAATVNDEVLVGAEFTICNAASVGSIERRYNTVELLEARRVMCDRHSIVIGVADE